jgi:hypothetical protein
MNSRSLLIAALVLAAACGGVFLFLQSATAPAPIPALTPVAPAPTPSPVPESIPEIPKPTVVKSSEPKPTAKPARPLEQWELKIDQALTSNLNETETAQVLLNLIPTLPPEGKAEATQHVTNLLPDSEYKRVLPLLKNTQMPAEVLDILVTDLMNREDTVKLPALLEIAKLPNHPNHEEALTDLQIFLDADHGSDWNKWTSSVNAYLKKQAEENAADLASPNLPPATPKLPGAQPPR